jgi:NtrC-family two-component system response regulator AlgB
VILTSWGNVKIAVRAMHSGAADFLEKPLRWEQLEAMFSRRHRKDQMEHPVEEPPSAEGEKRPARAKSFPELTSPRMREWSEVLLRAAPTPVSILISGESGTGKSMMARVIHEYSHRADRPFITVNCPSLSRELLESELFGHVKGAFTGAVRDHWGKVKAAEGGTLFLDEIGDLPLEIQPKLLRLLQEQEYERVGDNVTQTANVRVIAATNRDLKKRVADQEFREDLYFRLNVITVELPPLRERPDDLDHFCQYFIHHFAAQCRSEVVGLTDEVWKLFRHYPWPGNLRELSNVLERAVILSRDKRISRSDLPEDLQLENFDPVDGRALLGSNLTLEQLEEIQIRKVIQCEPILEKAAAILGIDQATLYRKRKKLKLKLHVRPNAEFRVPNVPNAK